MKKHSENTKADPFDKTAVSSSFFDKYNMSEL
jgi:hypothetical protein